MAALTVSLGAATPLYRLLYFVPGYNLFRAPARHLFEVHFALSVLFAFAVERIFRPGEVRGFLRQAAWTLAILFAAAFAATRALWLAAAVLRVPALRVFDNVAVNPLWTVGAAKAAVLANLDTAHRTILLPFVFFLLSLALLAVLARTRRGWTRAALPGADRGRPVRRARRPSTTIRTPASSATPGCARRWTTCGGTPTRGATASCRSNPS